MNAKISYVLKEIDGYLIDYLSFARDYTVTYARMYKRERIKIQIQNKYTIVAISVVFDDDIIAYKNFIQNDGTREQIYNSAEAFIHDSVNVILELTDKGYIRMPD